MAQPIRLDHYSYLEYRMLEEASSTKHEFLDGEIYVMAGGTPLHAALGTAVATALSKQLAGSDCRVHSSDLFASAWRPGWPRTRTRRSSAGPWRPIATTGTRPSIPRSSWKCRGRGPRNTIGKKS